MKKMAEKVSGFTLIELLVTVVVSMFLLTVGVPTIQTLLNSSERTTKINELITSLNRARSESLRRGDPVTICRKASDDMTSCANLSCNKTTHENCWETGWLVFVDENQSGSRDAEEEILRVYDFDPSKHVIISDEYEDFVSYGMNGEVTATGMFKYCMDWNDDGDLTDDVDAKNWIAVIVNLSGRPKLSSDINGDGIDEDSMGNNLACL